jgi:hypothetical protein
MGLRQKNSILHERIVISFTILKKDFLSYCQGIPRNNEQAYIGTTSQSTKLEYVPIVKWTSVVCVTLSL